MHKFDIILSFFWTGITTLAQSNRSCLYPLKWVSGCNCVRPANSEDVVNLTLRVEGHSEPGLYQIQQLWFTYGWKSDCMQCNLLKEFLV